MQGLLHHTKHIIIIGRAEIWNFSSERVRYGVEHEKRNSISPSKHVFNDGTK